MRDKSRYGKETTRVPTERKCEESIKYKLQEDGMQDCQQKDEPKVWIANRGY